MIAYMEGSVLERTENSCVLVTSGGVGYEVYLPEHALGALPARGGKASFYTCMIVREDAQELFGFPTWDERQTFLVLVGINRVGARTAMAILSQYRPDELRRMVLDDDASGLTRVSGIGKKTAQQIFLDLKYKLKADGPVAPAQTHQPAGSTVYHDALTGLANLGYDEDAVAPILRDVLAADAGLSVGEALRAALKKLAAGR